MSFWELVVIGVVALVVLGPEKLPGAIRSVTGFIAGIKQFGHQMKAELSDELRTHELQEKIREAEEKGILGLTSDELATLAELRQAAANVNQPYTPPEPTPLPPPASALPSPELTPPTQSPAQDSNEQKSPSRPQ